MLHCTFPAFPAPILPHHPCNDASHIHSHLYTIHLALLHASWAPASSTSSKSSKSSHISTSITCNSSISLAPSHTHTTHLAITSSMQICADMTTQHLHISNPHSSTYAPQGNPTANPHTAYAYCIALLQPFQPLPCHTIHAMAQCTCIHHLHHPLTTHSCIMGSTKQQKQQKQQKQPYQHILHLQQLYLTCTITHTYNSPRHHIQHAKLYRSHHSALAYQQPSLFHICPSGQPYR
jgi:hypothetical protein